MPVLLKSWYLWPNSKIPKRVCFCCLDFVLFYLFIFSKARVIILRSKRVVLYACPWIPITAMRRVWLPNSHPLTKGRRSVENEGWPELSSSFSFTPVVADGPSPPTPPPPARLVFSGQADILDILQRLKDKEPLAPNKAALSTPPEWEIWEWLRASGGGGWVEGWLKDAAEHLELGMLTINPLLINCC